MRLFVTGGAGFIGSNFIRYVLDADPDVQVTNFDKFTYAGNPATIEDLPAERHTVIRGDICDADAVADAMHGHDVVVNFAAESHVDRSITGSDDFMNTNVRGANQVFLAAMKHDIDRVLHISTDEVYGSIDEGSFAETDPLEPNSPYSASKAAADLLARAYRETYDFPIMVTRTANNFGPYHYPEKVIPLFITNLMDGKKVPLYGDGLNIRDWTHVEDNAAAQWMVVTDGEPGAIYNVGAGNEMTNKDLTYAILEQLDADESMIEHVTDRPGHDKRYSVDTTRIEALGWKPARTFAEGLEQTVAWYRANEDWWRPLKEAGASDRRGLDTSTE